jgi:uncharacterized membrane protein (UPF0127 family)
METAFDSIMACTLERSGNGIRVKVNNATKGVILGDAVIVASDSRTRRTGLLRHSTLIPGEGLWIVPCEAVHTFGMKFAIDVVFLSRKKQILKVRKNMTVRRIAICLRAHSVLELPAGMLDKTGTTPGDQLEFETD